MTGESAKEKESETRARLRARARAPLHARTCVCARDLRGGERRAASGDSRPVAASGLNWGSEPRYRARRADRRPPADPACQEPRHLRARWSPRSSRQETARGSLYIVEQVNNSPRRYLPPDLATVARVYNRSVSRSTATFHRRSTCRY